MPSTRVSLESNPSISNQANGSKETEHTRGDLFVLASVQDQQHLSPAAEYILAGMREYFQKKSHHVLLEVFKDIDKSQTGSLSVEVTRLSLFIAA